jgi:hypothetical protein
MPARLILHDLVTLLTVGGVQRTSRSKTVTYYELLQGHFKLKMAVFWVVAPCSLVDVY